MIPVQDIQLAKHILIECNNKLFIKATLLYSYCIASGKKVSLFSNESIERRYSFLAWYNKLRTAVPLSADLSISADINILDLYALFKKQNIKINKKIATAFYAAFLETYDNFLDPKCDGTIFAILSELLEAGAEVKVCVDELINKKPLKIFRLEALIYKKLLLKQNGELAYVRLSKEDFDASGALWDDALIVAKELLRLAHVQEVSILHNDDQEKIINLNKEV